MNVVLIDIPAEGWAHVRSSFAAKDTIKHSVPSYARSWSQNARAWKVHPECVHTLAEELRNQSFVVVVTDERRTRRAHWVEEAFDACEPTLRGKLRRALLSVFHPDVGGNPNLAQKINAVAEKHLRRTA